MAYDRKAAERVRRFIAGREDLVERKMMGGVSFMVNGRMCCSLNGTSLLVRVGRQFYEKALKLPHVHRMKIGSRVMSGFVRVDPGGYRTEEKLAGWLRRGIGSVSFLSP